MRIRTVGVAALALLPLLALAGCGNSTKDALTFNESIVSANQKLEAAGKEFIESVVRATRGDPEDVAQARKLYEKARQVMQQVKADMQSVHVPPSKSAQDLYDAHQKFLQAEEQMIDKDLGEAVKLLEDSKLSQIEKAQKVVAVFKRVGNTEQADLDALKKAQRTFAQDYNMTIK
jgi:hypothetical protein